MPAQPFGLLLIVCSLRVLTTSHISRTFDPTELKPDGELLQLETLTSICMYHAVHASLTLLETDHFSNFSRSTHMSLLTDLGLCSLRSLPKAAGSGQHASTVIVGVSNVGIPRDMLSLSSPSRGRDQGARGLLMRLLDKVRCAWRRRGGTIQELGLDLCLCLGFSGSGGLQAVEQWLQLSQLHLTASTSPVCTLWAMGSSFTLSPLNMRSAS